MLTFEVVMKYSIMLIYYGLSQILYYCTGITSFTIIGMLQRHCSFGPKPQQKCESPECFGFPVHVSYVYTIIQSIKCAIALCL